MLNLRWSKLYDGMTSNSNGVPVPTMAFPLRSRRRSSSTQQSAPTSTKKRCTHVETSSPQSQTSTGIKEGSADYGEFGTNLYSTTETTASSNSLTSVAGNEFGTGQPMTPDAANSGLSESVNRHGHGDSVCDISHLLDNCTFVPDVKNGNRAATDEGKYNTSNPCKGSGAIKPATSQPLPTESNIVVGEVLSNDRKTYPVAELPLLAHCDDPGPGYTYIYPGYIAPHEQISLTSKRDLFKFEKVSTSQSLKSTKNVDGTNDVNNYIVCGPNYQQSRKDVKNHSAQPLQRNNHSVQPLDRKVVSMLPKTIMCDAAQPTFVAPDAAMNSHVANASTCQPLAAKSDAVIPGHIYHHDCRPNTTQSIFGKGVSAKNQCVQPVESKYGANLFSAPTSDGVQPISVQDATLGESISDGDPVPLVLSDHIVIDLDGKVSDDFLDFFDSSNPVSPSVSTLLGTDLADSGSPDHGDSTTVSNETLGVHESAADDGIVLVRAEGDAVELDRHNTADEAEDSQALDGLPHLAAFDDDDGCDVAEETVGDEPPVTPTGCEIDLHCVDIYAIIVGDDDAEEQVGCNAAPKSDRTPDNTIILRTLANAYTIRPLLWQYIIDILVLDRVSDWLTWDKYKLLIFRFTGETATREVSKVWGELTRIETKKKNPVVKKARSPWADKKRRPPAADKKPRPPQGDKKSSNEERTYSSMSRGLRLYQQLDRNNPRIMVKCDGNRRFQFNSDNPKVTGYLQARSAWMPP